MLTFAPLILTSYADFLKQPHPSSSSITGSGSGSTSNSTPTTLPSNPLADCLRGQLIRVTNPPIPVK